MQNLYIYLYYTYTHYPSRRHALPDIHMLICYICVLCVCVYIYIYIYTYTHFLRRSLPRLLDSNSPGNSLWAWEFHPLNLRLPLSQALLLRGGDALRKTRGLASHFFFVFFFFILFLFSLSLLVFFCNGDRL